MQNSTEPLVDVIREAIISFFSADPSLLEQWGLQFDGELRNVLRRAGQQALSEVLEAEDERQRLKARAAGWRVERRPRTRLLTVLGPVTTRSSYLRRAGEEEGYRPMLSTYGIHGGQCTEALRRAVTDFGAERSFEAASRALEEHYGVAVASTTVRNVTLREAERISEEYEEYLSNAPEPDRCAEADTVVMGMDGCALRVIEGRHRVYRQVGGQRVPQDRVRLSWVDVRSAFARREGDVDRLCYTAAASFDTVLDAIQGAARRCGMKTSTQLVFVGDGGNGLMEAARRAFPECQFILDRMHLRQHIREVAEFLGVHVRDRDAWTERIDTMIGRGDVDAVIEELQPEIPQPTKGQAPPKDRISPFIEYLRRFRECTRYDEFEKHNWPIGSGEIESLHRQGPQPRLKLPGASWLRPNLNAMAGLRAARLSGRWAAAWEDRLAA